jgi:hypothetical protein
MATKKISQLTLATGVTGVDLVPIVQGGVTKRAAISLLGGVGATGPTGAAGSAGSAGATGAAGQSVTGPTGPAGATGASVTGPAGAGEVYQSDSAPAVASAGASWLDTDTGKFFTRYVGLWVEVGSDEGADGATGATGPTGAASSVAGPTGAASTVPGPTGATGAAGPDASSTSVAWAVNRYVSPVSATVGSGGALAANTIYLMPFIAPRSFSFSELGARVATAAASSNFQLAIYGSNSSGLPSGTAIASTASLSGASATALSASATGSLTGGVLYWMACNQDSSSLIYQAVSAASLLQTFTTGASTLAIATNGNSSATFFRTISGTFGTWPDLTSATTTETGGTQRTALIYMRVGSLP